MDNITGTLIWYYKICKRQVWLMSHGIVPDEKDENIELGRFIHEYYYKRHDKEIWFGNVKFDVLFEDEEKIIIGETKKSSKFFEASKYQLLYYLHVLSESGIKAKGLLLYPEERKRFEIELTDDTVEELNSMCEEIKKIIDESFPPKVKKIRMCTKCAYREYCFA